MAESIQTGQTPVVNQGGQPVVVPASSAPVVQQPVAQPATTELPAETSDRTKEQFDKLLESNRRLFENQEALRHEIARKTESNKTFQPIQEPVQTPVFVKPEDFVEVDPLSGERFINENKLQGAISELSARATKAEQIMQGYIQTAEQREVQKQNTETFEAYPELNPAVGEGFNRPFSDFTRAVIYDSMINPQNYGGRSLTFKEAADRVNGQLVSKKKDESTQGQTVQPTLKETQEAQLVKEQASLAATGQPANVVQAQATTDVADLAKRTRLGDTWAIAQRLKNIPHTRKAEETT